MRKLVQMLAAATLFSAALTAVPAQAVTIDFEDGTSQGELIEGQYEGGGVTFAGATILQAPDYPYELFPPHSGNSVIFNSDGFTAGDIRLFFSDLTFNLSAYATTSAPLILTVFGVDNVQLGTSILLENVGTNALIGYQGTGIASALFSTGDGSSFTLDDVSFGAAPSVSAAPEPSTWAMLILGFGLAGAALRRRRVATAAVSAA